MLAAIVGQRFLRCVPLAFVAAVRTTHSQPSAQAFAQPCAQPVGEQHGLQALDPLEAEGKRPQKEKKEQKPKGEKPTGEEKQGGKPKQGGAGKAEAGAAGAEDDKVTFNVDKDNNFAEWYDKILSVAGIVDRNYPVKGMPVFCPYGFYMHNEIMKFIEREWEAQDIQQALFPTVIPEEFLKKEEDHVKGFEAECFWVEKGGLKPLEKRLALRPTSETAMYSMFSTWIRSFRDLPLKMHQTCTIFRHETKDTRPLIRVREIPWNEAHTAHATVAEALENLEAAWGSYIRLISDALGVYGLRLRRPDWDKFAGAEHTDVMDATMPCGRVLQIVGAHYLGQKFARPFNIQFLNHNNEFEYAYMTCYGISTRILASAIANHGDSRGLVLPPMIAQYQVVIVPVLVGPKAKHPPVLEACRQHKAALQAAGIRVKLDDGAHAFGEKYYHWEMKGVPVRLEVGPRDAEANKVVIVARDLSGPEAKTADVPAGEMVAKIRTVFDEMLVRMKAKSRARFEERLTTCSTLEEVAVVMREKGGFARIPFHSMGMDGKEGDKIVHDATGGEVRGFVVNDIPLPEGAKCVATGKPAICWGYVARAY